MSRFSPQSPIQANEPVRSGGTLLLIAVLVTAFAAVTATAWPGTAVAGPCYTCEGSKTSGGTPPNQKAPVAGTTSPAPDPKHSWGEPAAWSPPAPPPAVEVHLKLWGAILSLDRSVGCFAARGIPEAGDLISATVPDPWAQLALITIALKKAYIGRNVGTEGVHLYFTPAGMWKAKPRGTRQRC